MDDIWDSEGEVPPEHVRVERNQNNHGFLEGVSEVADSSLQNGFDKGYVVGAHQGIRIGNILGTLQHYNLQDLEKKALEELTNDINSEHLTILISKWEQLVKSFHSSMSEHNSK